MRCIFYRHTADGPRCVLMPPEEWKTRRGQLEKFCTNGGNGCPVLARVLSLKRR
ncbi:metal-binding protein [Pyrobaculum calidifontis]|uniref:metal-binding protein n=1 Tax=Pyrobaculum calidifontis TaxID=181486 RepID=UPI0003244CED|nr:metal-binding protein [Pyrobaculum calidifontis]